MWRHNYKISIQLHKTFNDEQFGWLRSFKTSSSGETVFEQLFTKVSLLPVVDILTWTILPQDCLYLEPSPSVLDNLENAQLNILDDYYLLSILSKRELMYFLRILWILILAHQCQNERTLIFSLWLIYLNNVPIVHIQHSRDRGGAGPGPYVTLFHSHRYSSW